MSKIAVIGAGKTGRGFLGRLLKEGKIEIGENRIFLKK